MKTRTLILAALLVFSGMAFGQNAVNPGGWGWASTITTAGAGCSVGATNCLSLALFQSVGSGTVVLSGTFTGTLQFEASGDNGSTWAAIAGTPAGGGGTVTSATAAGTWQFSLAGYTNLRVRASALASGLVNASINTSSAAMTPISGAALDLSNLTSPTAINLTTLTFAGAAGLTAAGTNQKITLTPSGTGYTDFEGTNGTLLGFVEFASQQLSNAPLMYARTTDFNIVSGTRNLLLNTNAGYKVQSPVREFDASLYGTMTNCASSASPAVCAAAPAGRFVIAAGTASVVIQTTAVTANSEIQITEDQSLGTALGVTCNVGIAQAVVTARTPGTSFTVSLSSGLTVNPWCGVYEILN